MVSLKRKYFGIVSDGFLYSEFWKALNAIKYVILENVHLPVEDHDVFDSDYAKCSKEMKTPPRKSQLIPFWRWCPVVFKTAMEYLSKTDS